MATKSFAGVAGMRIVRFALVHRLNLPSFQFSSHAYNSFYSCFTTSAAASAAGARNGVPHLDGVQRWRVRSMTGDADSTEGRRMPARLAQKQQLLDAAPAYPDDANAPISKVSVENVTLSFARSGGAGGQNVNKGKAQGLFSYSHSNYMMFSEHEGGYAIQSDVCRLAARESEAEAASNGPSIILKYFNEKNRINGDGELVVSSTKTRTQKGNIDDALQKIQEMIDAASYVPPPPSEETKKKIQKLARIENERRLQDKKKSSSKKADRRNKGSWD